MSQRKPTLFALEGELREFRGDVLLLNTQLSAAEWEQVVSDTIHYRAFLVALKEVGCPALQEPWEDRDEQLLARLTRTVHRMRNLDALLVLKVDEDRITGLFKAKMAEGAKDVNQLVTNIRQELATRSVRITGDLG